MKKIILLAYIVLVTNYSLAGEFPIGEPIEKNSMEIAAVYLQAVKMEPMLPGMEKQTDIHLEADIHAIKGNNNGFGEGDWIPALQVDYFIAKKGSKWTTFGSLMPMVASDGPHYGENIKLNGIGKYIVTFNISPPPINGFYRHTDKETGVGKWWSPFSHTWEFTYTGVGKKGGY